MSGPLKSQSLLLKKSQTTTSTDILAAALTAVPSAIPAEVEGEFSDWELAAHQRGGVEQRDQFHQGYGSLE